ncbi:heparan-alpha-glucosaminide N-acetyltransferase domain-containing protein [Saccharopolyspora sp. NFXS83]|uniref:heparan-alpha-glucosaminide N-acetyltransferase domain-containing protein n=1 Tax=Saccharopolyspora sp. NFXS83 TaxID=2993560 RepID=UPI00224A8304|nr:heparan-alpha-glucosaminide N-acetyltransferase domain-containing protein [Saccharopolyspora sp. NFXS83]MCX2732725.1 heparan-alpha-glucosaminide N-acetyltransferase domain-containing protein [Saccharopolyspora sp. NFXS83]
MHTTRVSPSEAREVEAPPPARLIGVDVARGLAVLGMFAAHVGPPGWLHTLVAGRSAALFAVLAGLSIALLSGGSAPIAGTRSRVVLRIAIRAVVLFVLGLALSALQAPVMVILTSYGVLFLLSIPVLRWRATALAVLAAVFAVAGPLVSFFIRQGMGQATEFGATPGFDDFGSLAGIGTAFQNILLTGAYPVLTWIPFVLAGMALGRLELRAVRGRIAVIGAGLALLGYGGSWLAMTVFGGRDRVVELMGGALPPEMVDMLLSTGFGAVPTTDPVFLLSAGAHSGSPFEIIGATGSALLVVGVCLFVERTGVLLPVASVGALALTAYAGHIVALAAVGTSRLGPIREAWPWIPLLVLVVSTLAIATTWRALLGRGPLERVLHRVSTVPASWFGQR